jgi:prepilin-type N-terminal cleavage/methylation domain-containing protein
MCPISRIDRRHPEASGSGGHQASSGFTLVEMAVVLALVAIVSGIAFAALHQIKTRNNFSTSVSGLTTSIRKVRSDAYGSGATSVFVLNQNTGQYWGIEDVNNNFNLATFDANNPAPAPDILLFALTLPAPVVVGPSTGRGAAALPQPYSWVHVNSACTFCGANGLGSISFQVGSPATFSGLNPSDGSFTTQSPNDAGGWKTMTFAIIGRTSVVDTFEGSHG